MELKEVVAVTGQDAEVIELSDDDLRAGIHAALREAGVSLEELKEQGRRGRFSSNDARMAWFLVSAVGDRIDLA